MKSWMLKLLPAGIFIVLFGQSCSKIPVSPPPFLFPIQTLEQTPFHSHMDSVFALAKNDTILTITAAYLPDLLQPHSEGSSGQAEIAYAFRFTTAAAITSLGVLVPSQGFSHTVTLWDSASQQVLAQADVPSLDSGKFTYVSLALINQAVLIQPNHGYIVGFNSLAVGNSLNTYSKGNWIYTLDGIFDFAFPKDPNIPILPFTRGPVTFEGYYLYPYDTPISLPPFPGGASFFNSYVYDVPGVCDIGYISQ
jgi:hypothetical protein